MLTRRGMLRALGAGAFGLPLLESLTRRGWAQQAQFPTRLVLVTRGQGTLTDELVIPGTGPTDFALGPVLAPLAPWQDRLAVCGGLDDATNVLDGSYNGHTRCLLHTWTARGMVWEVGSDGAARPTGAGGPSVDQVVADAWAGSTPYRSLEFGVQADTQVIQTHNWRGIGQPVPPENDPAAMFERLFQDLVATDPAERAARLARRQRVLAAVKSQFDAVLPRVSAEDRVKLENHLTAIEGLETSLAGGVLGDACVPPDPDLADRSLPGLARAQIDQLAMALACDLTRVATLAFGDYQDWSWLGLDFPSGWHDAVHAGPVTVDLRTNLSGSYRWFSDQLALLLAALAAIPEGEGTVLDHTLVVVNNVFSTGSDHSHQNKTILLAGGGAGLVGGRNLDFGGAASGELFGALLEGLGLDPRFGDPAFFDRPLAGGLS
jgi:hypothetical protein